MRHRKARRHPKGASAHARAVLRNQACSLVIHGQIETTTPMAKCLRPYVERLITKAIHANAAESTAKRVSIVRNIEAKLRNRKALDLILNVVAKIFAERRGGYTRIIKSGFRIGDAAEMSVIQLVLDDPAHHHDVDDTDELIAAEKYQSVKELLLGSRTQNQRTILKWAAYPFPEIPVRICRSDAHHLKTLIDLPKVDAWDVEKWPTVASKRASLELEIQFLADPQLLAGAKVYAQAFPDTGKGLRVSSISPDARAVSILVDAHELTQKTVIEVVHELPSYDLATISVALVSPYSTLNRVRAYRI